MKHYKPTKCVVCSKIFTPTAANQNTLLRGVFNIVHYILINRNIPQFDDVSHEILILYNSLYIHINK